MNPALILSLIKLATQVPALVDDVRRLVTHAGVTDAQWEDFAHIIAQNPEDYFGPSPVVVPPTSTSIYNSILLSLPPVEQFVTGDEVYASPNGQLFYVVGATQSTNVPSGFTFYGKFDGTRIVTGGVTPEPTMPVADYTTVRKPYPIPTDAELKARGYVAGDRIYEHEPEGWVCVKPQTAVAADFFRTVRSIT